MKETLIRLAEVHGFGALVALLLMWAMYQYAPAFLRHTERDANREAVLLSICLNTAKEPTDRERCWTAIYTGDVRDTR